MPLIFGTERVGMPLQDFRVFFAGFDASIVHLCIRDNRRYARNRDVIFQNQTLYVLFLVSQLNMINSSKSKLLFSNLLFVKNEEGRFCLRFCVIQNVHHYISAFFILRLFDQGIT